MTHKIKKSDRDFLLYTQEMIRDKVELIDAERNSTFTLPSPSEIYEYLDSYVVGQDRAKKILSVGAHNHFKRLLIYRDSNYSEDSRLEKTNLMLIGPTGSGKTYLIKHLAEMLNVPYYVADANSLTASGYVGKDVDSIVEGLIDSAGKNYEAAMTGIIFIDEFDKICRKYDSSSRRDVGGESVQQALLKLLEGTQVEIEKSSGFSKYRFLVDTTNILFIVGGAFVGLENIIANRTDTDNASIGFSRSIVKKEPDKNIIKDVTVDDLEAYGFIPEILGRIPLIATLDELTEDDLLHIMTKVKHNLLYQYKKLFDYSDLELSFTDDGLRLLAREALKRKVGARGLKTLMETVLLEYMFELCSAEINEEEVKRILNLKDENDETGTAETV